MNQYCDESAWGELAHAWGAAERGCFLCSCANGLIRAPGQSCLCSSFVTVAQQTEKGVFGFDCCMMSVQQCDEFMYVCVCVRMCVCVCMYVCVRVIMRVVRLCL